MLKKLALASAFELGDQTHTVRYEAWRRIRAPIMLVGIAFVLLMAIVSIAWGQLVGLVVAMVFIMVVGIAEIIAQWNDASETIIAEAVGREQVRRRLKTLEGEGWRCVHRLRSTEGNLIDHIVWGPRGVFVIATRSDRGRIGVESGVLTLSGIMPPRHYIQDVHGQVTEIRERLSERLGRRVWVEGVICMTRAFVNGYQMHVPKPPTYVVHMERLLEFLGTFESRREITPEDASAIGNVLHSMEA
ncbi:MAG: NERD domain-containing protein [Phycisphaerae bacterium]|nr:NERD domain-containing protein [Phycisphaerae bacterium]